MGLIAPGTRSWKSEVASRRAAIIIYFILFDTFASDTLAIGYNVAQTFSSPRGSQNFAGLKFTLTFDLLTIKMSLAGSNFNVRPNYLMHVGVSVVANMNELSSSEHKGRTF